MYRTRRTVFAAAPATVFDLLDGLAADVDRVYLVGPRPGAGTPGGFEGWALGAIPATFAQHPRGHFLDGSQPVLRFARTDGDGKGVVEVHRAAAWFGEGDYSADTAAAAWASLGRGLVNFFGTHAQLLATPATTGRDLFLRTVPHGAAYPVLDDDDQAQVRATSGQGRMELFAQPAQLPALYAYDMRFGYAALLRGLGVGPLVRDRVSDFAGYRPGRYRVEFTVPRGWAHVGLLGVKHGDAADGWHWPAAGTWQTWADGAEVMVALNAGWRVSILERALLYGGAPLDTWARKLIAMRDACGDPADPAGPRALVRTALRAIVLHTIGAFHAAGTPVTRVAAYADRHLIPADARDLRRVDRRWWVWKESRGSRWSQLAHPEWSAAIWARCRARLLTYRGQTGALHVDPGTVVGFRTDAIYLTADPGWADDGRVGQMRRILAVPGPLPAPTNHADLVAVKAAA